MHGRRPDSPRARLDLDVIVQGLAAYGMTRHVVVDRRQMDANSPRILALANAMPAELTAYQQRPHCGRITPKATRRYCDRHRVIR